MNCEMALKRRSHTLSSFWTKSCLKNLSRNRKSWSWRCFTSVAAAGLHFICLMFHFSFYTLVAHCSLISRSTLFSSSYSTHFTLSICNLFMYQVIYWLRLVQQQQQHSPKCNPMAAPAAVISMKIWFYEKHINFDELERCKKQNIKSDTKPKPWCMWLRWESSVHLSDHETEKDWQRRSEREQWVNELYFDCDSINLYTQCHQQLKSTSIGNCCGCCCCCCCVTNAAGPLQNEFRIWAECMRCIKCYAHNMYDNWIIAFLLDLLTSPHTHSHSFNVYAVWMLGVCICVCARKWSHKW